ncbi:MAG: histidine--tRNA ligase [Planctomycetaceae bacterium]|nr:histidine--tRNA ligase [Planctomycetaceae bacterium]
MDFQAVKGTRDFYPEEMRLRNWIVDAWRRVSLRNGFEEYDSPIFEYLDLFTAKSGQEIAGQLFSFTDRGGRSLAIRPEITPALARMVNARVNALPRPIKWFSAPRLCRAENPQKGRLREFFQWNIDVIGSDDTIADAECIFTAVDFLREVGLTPSDVQVRIGSRPLTVAALKASGVTDDRIDAALAVLDKRAKVEDAEFVRLAKVAGMADSQIDAARRFQDCPACSDVACLLEGSEGVAPAVTNLQELLSRLAVMGAAEYCKLDLGVVRGLAYYTGVVYEVFDAGQSLRAIAGGGRYDNLLQVLGGPALGATGFGMGDVVLGILLAEKGKLPALGGRLDFFVIDAEGTFDKALAVVGALRRSGLSADFSYKRQAIGKQFKQASQRGAKFAAIIEPDGGVTVKDLTAGTQTKRGLDEFLANPT